MALLSVLAMTIGCGSSKTVKLSMDDKGSQVELKKGQSLVIQIEGNPTTGYTWEAVELEDILRQVGETEFEADSKLTGAGGVQTLRFEAVKAGSTTLKLVYHRPWEKDTAPAETCTFPVVVR